MNVIKEKDSKNNIILKQFVDACATKNNELIRELYDDDLIKQINCQNVFEIYIKNGKENYEIEIIDLLNKNDEKLDVHLKKNVILKNCCNNKNISIDVFNYICSLSGHEIESFINYKNGLLFDISCMSGNIELAKYIYSFNKIGLIEIRKNKDFLYKYCCLMQITDCVNLLMSLCEDYDIEIREINDEKIIKHKINFWYNREYTKNEAIKKMNLIVDNYIIKEDCIICKDISNLKTNCKHYLCLNCTIEWCLRRDNKECPYCKSDIKLEECVTSTDVNI